MRLDEDRRRFLARALAISAILFAAAAYAGERYRIAIDRQTRPCLPWRVFLLDLDQRSPQIGGYYAFVTDALAPRFPKAARIVKQIAAGPGDIVAVRQGVLRINGTPMRRLEPEVLTALGREAASFDREQQLTRDEFLFLGTEPGAYDGRYWGTVARSQIIARATPLW